MAVVLWLGASDLGRRRLRFLVLIALLAAMGMFTSGAWHGGEMVYRQGFGVDGRQAIDYSASEESAEPGPKGPFDKDKIDDLVSPMQIHLILAGLVIAMAAGALGLSLRHCVAESQPAIPPPAPESLEIDPASPPQPGPAKSVFSLEELAAAREAGDPPPTRFWILAAFLAALTIILGFYVGDFLTGRKFFNVEHLQRAMQDLRDPDKMRMGMHIILGSAILVLCLILALLGTMRPGNRGLVSFFALLLMIAVAGQIWMGILLLYDTDRGPLTKFNVQPPAPTTTQPATTQ
jgi:uncharacterized membrane protein YhaH (DUF805 family)